MIYLCQRRNTSMTTGLTNVVPMSSPSLRASFACMAAVVGTGLDRLTHQRGFHMVFWLVLAHQNERPKQDDKIYSSQPTPSIQGAIFH